MTTYHPRSPDRPAPSPDGDRVVAVTGWDGTLLATLTRSVDHGPAGPLTTVIAVDGDIDQDTAPALEAALVDALNGGTPVCCDVRGTAFFGAAGINTLLAAHRHAGGLGHDFFLRGMQGQAGRVLRLTELTGVVRCED